MGANDTLTSLIGKVDNLNDPTPLVNKSSTILGVTISLQVLAWICGALRLWVRFKIIKKPWYDDVFVCCALVMTTLSTIMIGLGSTTFGFGKHFVLLGKGGMADFLKGLYVANGAYVTSTSLVKLALLFQYLQVFERGTFQFRFTIFMIVFVALWGFAYFIVVWFPCSPIDAYWALNPNSHCYGYASQKPSVFIGTFESQTATNLLLDLIILSIPVPLYFRQGTQKKTKLGLTAILTLGGVVNAVAIWRLADIVRTGATTKPTFDPSWYGCLSVVLAAVEVDLAVVCASVPVFWPVLQRTGFQIFVTREVEVKSESRRLDESTNDDFSSGMGVKIRDAGALPAGVPDPEHGRGHGSGSLRSHASSESTLRNVSSGEQGGKQEKMRGNNKDEYWKDDTDYMMDHLDQSGRQRGPQPGMEVSVSANDRVVRNMRDHQDNDNFLF